MRRICWIPGPDPQVCAVPTADGHACGGPMSIPFRGQMTGLWLRTCRDCHETTFTRQTPDFAAPRGPLGRADFGYLEFDDRPIVVTKPIARPSRFDASALPAGARRAVLDARQRQAGERE